MVEKHAAFLNQLLDNYEEVPDEDAGCAQDQQDGFRSLKTEIDVAMTEVHQKIAMVSQIIKANAKSEDNPEGLLVQGR